MGEHKVGATSSGMLSEW